MIAILCLLVFHLVSTRFIVDQHITCALRPRSCSRWAFCSWDLKILCSVVSGKQGEVGVVGGSGEAEIGGCSPQSLQQSGKQEHPACN